MKQDRKDVAQHILDHLDQFKCCELCYAIVPKDSLTCPECYAYRFCEDAKLIEDRVLEFASRKQRALERNKQYED